jgi:tetratricopeptide (TPR) repeat protein
MFFNENNDDDENDDFGGSFKPIDELLAEFNKAKRGEKHVRIEEEEFEFLISYFESENDKENIEIACEIGIETFPFSSELLLRKCAWLTNQTKFGQALKALDAVDAIDPHSMEALLLRVDIYCDMNKYEDAVRLLEVEFFKKAETERIEILMELSEIYDELEEFENVYNSLKRILEIDPNNEEALLRICFWADITNREEESILLYNSIIEKNPFNTMAWYNLGTAYQGLKLYEKAVESYEYCIALDNKFEYAYRNIGDAFIQLKQYDKAIEVLEKHISLGKPEDVILEALGFCWEKKKDYSKARKFYLEASLLSPDDDGIFFKIGETYKAEQKWEKAMKAFTTALRLNKENSAYSLALGNCLVELGAPKEALVCYLNAVRLKPANKSSWQSLIKALYISDYFEEALGQIELAQDMCGFKPEFDYYKAAVHLALGKTKDAVLILEAALQIAPQKVSALKFIDSEIINHPAFTDVLARHKKKR